MATSWDSFPSRIWRTRLPVTSVNANGYEASLVCSYLTGKAVITIDDSEFDISTRPFGLKGTNQMFRLGDMAAIIDFPKSGEPDIIIDGNYVRTGKEYNT